MRLREDSFLDQAHFAAEFVGWRLIFLVFILFPTQPNFEKNMQAVDLG